MTDSDDVSAHSASDTDQIDEDDADGAPELCGAEKRVDDPPIDGPAWGSMISARLRCTRDIGHDGNHVCEGEDGEWSVSWEADGDD